MPLLAWLDSLPAKAVVPPGEIDRAVARKKQFLTDPERYTFTPELE